MNFIRKKVSSSLSVLLAVALFLLIPAGWAAQDKIVELKFAQPPSAESDAARTLASLVKVRDIGEQYATGGLYLMTHFGDREDLFRKENQKAIDHPLIGETWRACSIFSTKIHDRLIMGRNWDNQNVGSIIVSLYRPAERYASVSFTRAIDMGFPLNMDLEDIASSPIGSRLLLAPFYAYDGLNEKGLAAAVAGVGQITLKPQPNKQRVFDPYLIRKILDCAKTVDEAVGIAEEYVPFDVDENSLNAHFYVVDASGRSVILEYDGKQWQKIYGQRPWQVLTNKTVWGVDDAILREKCWRYKRISETLERTVGDIDWRAGLKLLQDVTQKGTTWSVVYSPTARDLFFSVYQTWSVIYHLRAFE
jgi:hypothetical protein